MMTEPRSNNNNSPKSINDEVEYSGEGSHGLEDDDEFNFPYHESTETLIQKATRIRSANQNYSD